MSEYLQKPPPRVVEALPVLPLLLASLARVTVQQTKTVWDRGQRAQLRVKRGMTGHGRRQWHRVVEAHHVMLHPLASLARVTVR